MKFEAILPKPCEYLYQPFMRTRIRGLSHVIILLVELLVFRRKANGTLLASAIANIGYHTIFTGYKVEKLFRYLDLLTIFPSSLHILSDITRQYSSGLYKMNISLLLIFSAWFVIGFSYFNITNIYLQVVGLLFTLLICYRLLPHLTSPHRNILTSGIKFFLIYIGCYSIVRLCEAVNIPYLSPLTESMLLKYPNTSICNIYDIGHICCLIAYSCITFIRSQK